MEKDVNHPEYYLKEKNDGLVHPECIDLLDFICQGYSGVASGIIFQAKYAFRAGSKTDAGLEQSKKTAQEYKKLHWYLSDLLTRSKLSIRPVTNPTLEFPRDETYLQPEFMCSIWKHPTARLLVADQFAYDKPDNIKENVRDLIYKISMLQTYKEVEECLETLEKIITTLNGNPT